jgi:hypothetical protein
VILPATARRKPCRILLHGIRHIRPPGGVELNIAHPRNVIRIALEDAGAFCRIFQALSQAADDRAIRVMQFAVSIRDVVSAVVEIARMALGVEDVNGVNAI